jgi:hypothetical protein
MIAGLVFFVILLWWRGCFHVFGPQDGIGGHQEVGKCLTANNPVEPRKTRDLVLKTLWNDRGEVFLGEKKRNVIQKMFYLRKDQWIFKDSSFLKWIKTFSYWITGDFSSFYKREVFGPTNK